MDKQNRLIFGGAVIIIILVTGLLVLGKGRVPEKPLGVYKGEYSLSELSNISSCPLTEDKDNFAKCLTEKGFVMYGAYWCPHCQNQKLAFGDSFKYIKYIECTEEVKLCIDKNIKGYPTWLLGATTTNQQ